MLTTQKHSISSELYLGDVENLPDNVEDSEDEIKIVLLFSISDVLDGDTITVTASTVYSGAQGPVTLSNSVTFQTAVPYLTAVSTVSSDTVDAGDTVTLQIVVSHTEGSLVSAYRVNLTVAYPSDFILNQNSVAFQSIEETTSKHLSFDLQNGEILFEVSELLLNGVDMIVTMQFEVSTSVKSNSTIHFEYNLEWHNLPFDLSGGKSYSAVNSHGVAVPGLTANFAQDTNSSNVTDVYMLPTTVQMFVFKLTFPEGTTEDLKVIFKTNSTIPIAAIQSIIVGNNLNISAENIKVDE